MAVNRQRNGRQQGSGTRGRARGTGSAGQRGRAAGRPSGQRKPRSRHDASDGREWIEGRRAAGEALESGTPIKRALVARDSGGRDGSLEELVGRLEAAGVPIEEVPRERLEALSSHGAHQGIALEVRPFEYVSLRTILERAGDGDALVVALDHVTDEGNFGAIVRSAEVVGAAGVIIPKARSARVGTAAYKTSAGAVLHVPIAQVPNLSQALDTLKEAGFWVGGASEHAEEDVWHAPLEGRLCLVMGSEGAGISSLVRKKCDFGCRLPQRGVVESLNVAQATTVLCYEWLRRTLSKQLEGE